MSEVDEYFMRIALDEAREGYSRGDFPVGAVITFDKKLIGKGSNFATTNREWISHAESSLIRAYAPSIQRFKNNEKVIELYTTLEPCLMCIGTSLLNRIDRIVYSCPDPNGGATRIDIKTLPEWYAKKWPKIQSGILREESYEILRDYMEENERWHRILKLFEEMHSTW